MDNQKLFLFDEDEIKNIINSVTGMLGLIIFMHDDEEEKTETIKEKLQKKINLFHRKIIEIKNQDNQFIEKNIFDLIKNNLRND